MSLYCGISDGETACYVLAGSESRSLGVSVSEILQDCHSERSSLSRTESDPSADLALPGEPLTHTRYPTTLTPPSKSLRLPKFICPFIETVPLSRFRAGKCLLCPDKSLLCWLWEHANLKSKVGASKFFRTDPPLCKPVSVCYCWCFSQKFLAGNLLFKCTFFKIILTSPPLRLMWLTMKHVSSVQFLTKMQPGTNLSIV